MIGSPSLMATEKPNQPACCALGLVSVIVLSALAAGKNSITESARATLKHAFVTLVWAKFKASHFQVQGKM
jgi:hypothetical protein